MPQKIAYLDCHSGISGDMFLGAMLDTGLSLDTLKTSLASLPAPVRDTSLAIFQRLADAEASVHGTSIEEVHFHEVGAIDALVDITGAAIAVESLGIVQFYASPLPLTSGHVNTAHGSLPVPAPATLEILRRVAAPWR